MALETDTVQSFLNDLASSEPTPGGGSVAALAAALGAALVSMVCNLTIGKKGYEDAQNDVEALLAASEGLRGKLTALIAEDVAAFSAYSEAAKLPRATPEERATRTDAVQSALKEAAAVPMGIARAATEVMNLCRPCAEKGNRWAVSDAGVAVLMAEGALKSAALNVLINLSLLKDEQFVAGMRTELEDLLSGTVGLCDEVYEFVRSKL